MIDTIWPGCSPHQPRAQLDARYAPGSPSTFNQTYGQKIGRIPSFQRASTPPAGFAGCSHADGLTGVNIRPYRTIRMGTAPLGKARRPSCSWKALSCPVAARFAIHGGKTWDGETSAPMNHEANIGFVRPPKPTLQQVDTITTALAQTSERNLTPDLVARLELCRSRSGARTAPPMNRFPGYMNSWLRAPSPSAQASHNLRAVPGSPSVSQTSVPGNHLLGFTSCMHNSTMSNESLKDEPYPFPAFQVSDSSRRHSGTPNSKLTLELANRAN